jgi:hemin uptake protein HemP
MNALTPIFQTIDRHNVGLPQHDALALTQGGNQALIELDGKVYTLRITRAGKLILTK